MKIKVRITISVIIFLTLVILLESLTEIKGVPLSEIPWGEEKLSYWICILITSGIFASIPWWFKILKHIFK